MSEPLASRHEQMLGEFAEWLHASAREAHTRLMESETAEDFATYNNALHKLGRGLRQTLALHKRFAEERLQGEAHAAAEAAEARDEEVQARRARIGRAVARRLDAAWTETEDLDDNERFNEELARLNDRLDDLAGAEDFLNLDPEALIVQLCAAFGLDVPAHIVQTPAIAAQADAPRPAPNGHDSS